jgi:hypothetical protein
MARPQHKPASHGFGGGGRGGGCSKVICKPNQTDILILIYIDLVTLNSASSTNMMYNWYNSYYYVGKLTRISKLRTCTLYGASSTNMMLTYN